MTRTAVTSSNLRSVGYDPSSRTLEIEFKNVTYQYADVPLEVYEALMAATSLGRYFIQNIKDAYPASKIA